MRSGEGIVVVGALQENPQRRQSQPKIRVKRMLKRYVKLEVYSACIQTPKYQTQSISPEEILLNAHSLKRVFILRQLYQIQSTVNVQEEANKLAAKSLMLRTSNHYYRKCTCFLLSISLNGKFPSIELSSFAADSSVLARNGLHRRPLFPRC